MAELGRKFGLTPQQTQSAVAALLPAISSAPKPLLTRDYR